MQTHSIYISGELPPDDLSRDFAARLRNEGMRVFCPERFLGYDVISREISGSDALLALITPVSYSATRQGIEVSLASGYPGVGWEPVPAARPVFIYATTELPGYIHSLDMSPRPPIHVGPAAEDAVATILRYLTTQALALSPDGPNEFT